MTARHFIRHFKDATPVLWTDGEIYHRGDSLCNVCDREMLGCWNVVCSRCERTFCYDHAKAVEGLWVCDPCRTQKQEGA